jgi:hypothetical protein
MQALTEGHKYLLDSFEGSQGQTLQFFERDAGGNVLHDGTTNEEVLAMLVDRLKALNERVPARETSIAITKLEEALLWLSKRTEDRKARGVEGTFKT